MVECSKLEQQANNISRYLKIFFGKLFKNIGTNVTVECMTSSQNLIKVAHITRNLKLKLARAVDIKMGFMN